MSSIPRAINAPRLLAYLAGRELPKLRDQHFTSLTATRNTLGKFLGKEILPHVKKWEETGSYMEGGKVRADNLASTLSKLSNLGLLGISVPEELGGAGLPYHDSYSVVQMLAKVWPALAVTVCVNQSVEDAISKFGFPSQKRDILSSLAERGLGAIAITEPQAGSDVSGIRTFARKEGDKYVLNGSKIFITSAGLADVYLTFALTDSGRGDGKKISAFLVGKNAPGFSIGSLEHKLGQKSSPTGEIVFEECALPEEMMLGKPGEGMKILYHLLSGGRIGIASLAQGIAEAAYETAAEYAQQRKQFGQPIGNFPEIKDMLAQMKYFVHASEVLIKYAAYLKDNFYTEAEDINAVVTAASMAKYYASEKGKIVAANALQIHGGNGYSIEYPLGRYLNDIAVTSIYEGTSQIQKYIIGKHLPLFVNSIVETEKTIDLFFADRPSIAGHEEEIGMIYDAMNEAKKELQRAINDHDISYHDSILLTDYMVARLMMLKTALLANHDGVSREGVEENLAETVLAAKFLGLTLDSYRIFK